jgi:serine/threonine protein kinase
VNRKLPPHPNVVQVFGVSLDGPQPVIVMEYCGGGTQTERGREREHKTERENVCDIIKSFQLINSFSFIIKRKCTTQQIK